MPNVCGKEIMDTNHIYTLFPSVLRHCWLGDRNCIWPVKKLVGLLVVMFGWRFPRLIAPVVTTTSITLSSNKIQNGYILVPANPGPNGKWPLKQRENIMATLFQMYVEIMNTNHVRIEVVHFLSQFGRSYARIRQANNDNTSAQQIKYIWTGYRVI